MVWHNFLGVRWQEIVSNKSNKIEKVCGVGTKKSEDYKNMFEVWVVENSLGV